MSMRPPLGDERRWLIRELCDRRKRHRRIFRVQVAAWRRLTHRRRRQAERLEIRENLGF